MSRQTAIWGLCFGLVFARLLGLHAHACAGLEVADHPHESPHYADIGLLFGESHADDHPDNLELELSATVAATKLQLDAGFDDPGLPVADALNGVALAGWRSACGSRGPPDACPTRPAHFAPPLRGPPSHSLA